MKNTEFDHLKKFRSLVTTDTFERIVKTAITAAENGDAQARSWIACYCLGLPKDVPCRLSGIDGQQRMDAESQTFIDTLYPAKTKKGARP
jgi:hypothetical protein